MTDEQRLISSKRLNRIKIKFSDDLMSVNTYWCRVSMLESEKFNRSSHHHAFFEIHYAITGSSDFFINEHHVVLEAGKFLLIPPMLQHRIEKTSDDFTKFICGFEIVFNENHPDTEFYRKIFGEIDGLKTYSDNAMLRQLPDWMLYLCYKQSVGTYAGITYALRMFLNEITIQISSEENLMPSTSQLKQYKKENEWVDKVSRFIEDNISNKLTGNIVAEQFHISLRQLNRILLSESEMTVSQMISKVKLLAISDMLENTSMTLEEIAIETGFSNGYNLNRFFSCTAGLTPGKYRMLVKGKNKK